MTTSNPSLIVIDVQNGIDEAEYWGGNRSNPEAEENIATLIDFWRRNKLSIFFVKHNSVNPQSPFRPGQEGNEFKKIIAPREGEAVIIKSTANAFVKTSLRNALEKSGISEVVITGFVTNNSVEATARMAGDLGYMTHVVADATACFDKKGLDGVTYSAELIHLISLSNLNDEYARIVRTKEVINFSFR